MTNESTEPTMNQKKTETQFAAISGTMTCLKWMNLQHIVASTTCGSCECPLTVENTLVECPSLLDIRRTDCIGFSYSLEITPDVFFIFPGVTGLLSLLFVCLNWWTNLSDILYRNGGVARTLRLQFLWRSPQGSVPTGESKMYHGEPSCQSFTVLYDLFVCAVVHPKPKFLGTPLTQYRYEFLDLKIWTSPACSTFRVNNWTDRQRDRHK